MSNGFKNVLIITCLFFVSIFSAIIVYEKTNPTKRTISQMIAKDIFHFDSTFDDFGETDSTFLDCSSCYSCSCDNSNSDSWNSTLTDPWAVHVLDPRDQYLGNPTGKLGINFEAPAGMVMPNLESDRIIIENFTYLTPVPDDYFRKFYVEITPTDIFQNNTLQEIIEKDLIPTTDNSGTPLFATRSAVFYPTDTKKVYLRQESSLSTVTYIPNGHKGIEVKLTPSFSIFRDLYDRIVKSIYFTEQEESSHSMEIRY